MENIEKIFDINSDVIISTENGNSKYIISGNLVPFYYLNREGKKPGLRGVWDILIGKATLTSEEFRDFLKTIDYLQ
jgi:ABC-type Fe3+-hydroxamate transport system substrate-binding protein